mmetsp:Transcript_104472/g.185838  ORF Transcript_104472/g.185838 Transcript_104472/m.185838 type:complete len:472 (+) Transcript_104472:68-1483(+)
MFVHAILAVRLLSAGASTPFQQNAAVISASGQTVLGSSPAEQTGDKLSALGTSASDLAAKSQLTFAKTVCLSQPAFSRAQCDFLGCCKWDGECLPKSEDTQCPALAVWMSVAAGTEVCERTWSKNDCESMGCCKFEEQQCKSAVGSKACQAGPLPPNLQVNLQVMRADPGASEPATASDRASLESMILEEAAKASQRGVIASLLEAFGILGAGASADPAAAAQAAYEKSKQLALPEEQALDLASRASAAAAQRSAQQAGASPEEQVELSIAAATEFLRKHTNSAESLALHIGHAAGYTEKNLGRDPDAQQKAAIKAAKDVVKNSGLAPELLSALSLRAATAFIPSSSPLPASNPGSYFGVTTLSPSMANDHAGPSEGIGMLPLVPQTAASTSSTPDQNLAAMPGATPAPCESKPPPCPPSDMATPVYDSPSGENPDIPLTEQRRPVRETGKVTSYINKQKLGKLASTLVGR